MALSLVDLEKTWLQEQYAPGLSRNLPVALVKENLVKNPSFEVNTTEWDVNSSTHVNAGAVVALDAGWFSKGTKSAQITCDGIATQEGINLRPVGLLPNKVYTFSVTVRWVSGRPVRLRIRDATNSISGTDSAFVSVATPTRLTVSITTGVLGNVSLVCSVVQDTTLGVGVFNIDEAVLVEGTNSDYFDGDTVDTYNTGYSWTGTAHASTSKSTLTSVRENLVKNPSSEVDLNHYGVWTGTGGVAPLTRVAGGYVGGFFCRATWSTASTAADGGMQVHSVELLPVVAGKTYTASIMLRSNIAQTAPCRFTWYNASMAQIGVSTSASPAALVPNTWTKDFVTAVAPASAAFVTICAFVNGGIVWSIGATLDLDAVLFNEGTNSNYFDGDTTDFYNVDHTWTGAAHASTSKLTTSPMGITLRENLVKNPSAEVDLTGTGVYPGVTGVAALTRPAGGFVGGFFCRATWSVANTTVNSYLECASGVGNGVVVPSKTYTSSLKVRCSKVQTVALETIYWDNASGFVSSFQASPVVLVANTWTTLVATGVAPSNSVRVEVRVVIPATGSLWAIGDTLDVDAVLLNEGSDSTYFDGDTADFTNGNYVWTGTPHASTSRLHAPEPVLAENLHTNPQAKVNSAFYQIGGAAGVLTRETVNPPVGFTSYARITHDASVTEIYPGVNQMPIIEGKVFSVGVWVRCSITRSLTMILKYGALDVISVTKTVTANVWTYFSTSYVVQVGVTLGYFYFVSSTANEILELTGVVFSQGSSAVYFDGDSPGAYWTGVAHASTSRLIDVASRNINHLEREFYAKGSGLVPKEQFSTNDHERAWLIANYVNTGRGVTPSLLTYADLACSRWEALSGLTPQQKFSVTDHEREFYRVALGL